MNHYTRLRVKLMALEKSKYFPKCAFTFSFENFLLHHKHRYTQRGFCNTSTHASFTYTDKLLQTNSLNTRFFSLNSLMRRTLLTLLNLTVQSSHNTGVKWKPYQQLYRAATKWMLKEAWIFFFFLGYISEIINSSSSLKIKIFINKDTSLF